MGCGKSIIVLNAIDALIAAGFKGKFLIIAPLRVARSVWSNEVSRWRHLSYLKISPIVGTERERRVAITKDADIYTCNYENLPWLVDTLGISWPYRMVIADESTRLKSHRSHFRAKKDGKLSLVCTGGSRSKAIAQLAFTKTQRFVCLTGTPAPNGLQDLWGSQWFVDKGAALGNSYSAFENRWYRKDYNGFTMTMLPHAEKEIRDAIASTTFTLKAEDYMELGEEITNTLFVDLPPAVREKYAAMEKELYIEIKAGAVEVFTMAARLTKLRQICNGFIYFDKMGSWEALHDAKIEALRSVIEEAAGMPVLVVYSFRTDLIRLQKAFPQGRAFDTKAKTEKEFKAGKIPILFIHPDSGGHGIDGFQYVTNIICFFSVDYNLESRMQVIARIGKVRQFQAGYSRPTFIHQIIVKDSIDGLILESIERKCSIENVLRDGLARRYGK